MTRWQEELAKSIQAAMDEYSQTVKAECGGHKFALVNSAAGEKVDAALLAQQRKSVLSWQRIGQGYRHCWMGLTRNKRRCIKSSCHPDVIWHRHRKQTEMKAKELRRAAIAIKPKRIRLRRVEQKLKNCRSQGGSVFRMSFLDFGRDFCLLSCLCCAVSA